MSGAYGTRSVMAVARPEQSFEPAERDVFLYLVGQAATSIENIALHELVSEQAITDDLTGLSNKRRFRDIVTKEAERAHRFEHALSLLMLDIDDFKRVNDTYGHPQGDEVLRRVARALESESRWVDEPVIAAAVSAPARRDARPLTRPPQCQHQPVGTRAR